MRVPEEGSRPNARRLATANRCRGYIRRLVACDLELHAPAGDPSAIFGLFDSGGSRIADGKQAMVSEAIDKFAAKGR